MRPPSLRVILGSSRIPFSIRATSFLISFKSFRALVRTLQCASARIFLRAGIIWREVLIAIRSRAFPLSQLRRATSLSRSRIFLKFSSSARLIVCFLRSSSTAFSLSIISSFLTKGLSSHFLSKRPPIAVIVLSITPRSEPSFLPSRRVWISSRFWIVASSRSIVSSVEYEEILVIWLRSVF